MLHWKSTVLQRDRNMQIFALLEQKKAEFEKITSALKVKKKLIYWRVRGDIFTIYI